MTPNEYQTWAHRTECDQEASRDRMNYRSSIRFNHAVIGLMGEVGELAAALEKTIYYGRDLDLTNVTEEVGDCMWYIALICNALGLNLERVMEANIRKLSCHYPEKYADNGAVGRDTDAERAVIVQDGHGFGHVEESHLFSHTEDDGPNYGRAKE